MADNNHTTSLPNILWRNFGSGDFGISSNYNEHKNNDSFFEIIQNSKNFIYNLCHINSIINSCLWKYNAQWKWWLRINVFSHYRYTFSSNFSLIYNI